MWFDLFDTSSGIRVSVKQPDKFALVDVYAVIGVSAGQPEQLNLEIPDYNPLLGCNNVSDQVDEQLIANDPASTRGRRVTWKSAEYTYVPDGGGGGG